MKHPFQEEVVQAIDEEKKCFKMHNRKCRLLDENGWCKLVLNCGKEALSHTCTTFPRMNKIYGDVTELLVEIACPVVAEYLFQKRPVCFDYQEIPLGGDVTDFDYQKYDILSFCRSFFVEIVQEKYQGSYAGKVYLVLNATLKIREQLNKDIVEKDEIITILHPLQSCLGRQMLYSRILELSGVYENKATVLQNIIATFLEETWSEFSFLFSTQEEVDNTIISWGQDLGIFADALKTHHEMLLEKYPHMIENFLVYSLFRDWLEMKKEFDIGEKFFIRIVEFSIIQVLFMAKMQFQEMTEKEMAVIISKADRILFHSEFFSRKIKLYLTDMGYMDLGHIIAIMLL